jgi:hypothetical protein
MVLLDWAEVVIAIVDHHEIDIASLIVFEGIIDGATLILIF